MLGLGFLGLAQAASLNIYPPYPVNGTSSVQFAVDGPFDGPKADFFNQTTYQWWYYDVVSDDLSQSIVLTFFIGSEGAGGVGFPGLPFNIVEVNLQLANGSVVSLVAPAESVAIATVGDGASGFMNGTGYSWFESSDLSFLYIDVNDKTNNLTGSLKFFSDAPPHAVCGPAVEGASLAAVPDLGWANAIPDATAYVDLKLGGEGVKYQGVGYHDSDWGDGPLTDNMTWYWGHARVGVYSLVWSDILNLSTGTEYQSGYVGMNGTIVSASCGTMSVRPRGENSTYPPIPGAEPSGFHIVYDMGDQGILDVNVTNYENVAYQPPQYARWVGKTVGGIRGQEVYEGVGLYEWLGA